MWTWFMSLNCLFALRAFPGYSYNGGNHLRHACSMFHAIWRQIVSTNMWYKQFYEELKAWAFRPKENLASAWKLVVDGYISVALGSFERVGIRLLGIKVSSLQKGPPSDGTCFSQGISHAPNENSIVSALQEKNSCSLTSFTWYSHGFNKKTV